MKSTMICHFSPLFCHYLFLLPYTVYHKYQPAGAHQLKFEYFNSQVQIRFFFFFQIQIITTCHHHHHHHSQLLILILNSVLLKYQTEDGRPRVSHMEPLVIQTVRMIKKGRETLLLLLKDKLPSNSNIAKALSKRLTELLRKTSKLIINNSMLIITYHNLYNTN